MRPVTLLIQQHPRARLTRSRNVPRVNHVRAVRRFTIRPVLPGPLEGLREIVANLRWSWDLPTQRLFADVDPALWESVGHDPARMLGEVSQQRWDELADDQEFVARLRAAVDDLRRYRSEPRWYASVGPDAPASIAYFSPEYGITHVLPQYSGGLGILAGDHLKAASDLGVPVIGIGLLYRHGYFQQSLSSDGWQREHYPVVDPAALPLTLLREADGTPCRVHVGLAGGRRLAAAVWRADVGRVPLLLLDTHVEENSASEREVSDRLYGGGSEHRLAQEMLLGLGGVRALRLHARLTATEPPTVFHTNEGHAGFLGVQRLAELVAQGVEFEAALAMVRAGTVFTTHTPVPAGIDRFDVDLVAQYLSGDEVSQVLDVSDVLGLGAETHDGGDPGVFNMAVMGFRLAGRANAVSRLHGRVSRAMFAPLWPGLDEDEVPITSVTNGVHGPTWAAPEVADIAARAGTVDTPDDYARALDGVSDAELWAVRRVLRERLVTDVRRRLSASARHRAGAGSSAWVDTVLDPDVLTIGFARRVPTYKRLTLMLRDPDRLRTLLLDEERPVQVVVAGKAHPADDTGKRLIQEMVQFADDPDVRHRIVVLPDYDMSMAAVLVPGCDVWLNNPRRPLEACGTSGMKAALNGGLNLSVLDGWWDEWFDGRNGWTIASGPDTADAARRDDAEADSLYGTLESSVVPAFYDRDESGTPRRWVAMVRHTMATLGPMVQATRMVADYTDGLYRPAARSARAMTREVASDLVAFAARARREWPSVAVDHVDAGPGEPDATQRSVGELLPVRAYVRLGDLRPDEVSVHAVHGHVDDADRLETTRTTLLEVVESYEQGRYCYEGSIPLVSTGPFGYTVRVVPHHPGVESIADLGLVAYPASAPGLTDGDLR